jgi:MFS transporter, ACS family, solute carrier family 17 (sodium-dependent inorganic phosphate cotransporter), other
MFGAGAFEGERLRFVCRHADVSRVAMAYPIHSRFCFPTGMYLGSTVGLLSCPPLIAAFGWQSVFYFFGALGGIWFAGWQLFSPVSPAQSTTISASELEYIEAGTETTKRTLVDAVPWKQLMSNGATWAIIVAHFCCTWGFFTLNAWLPTYFSQELGFDLASSAFLSVLPWLAMFLFANAGGQIADGLFRRGMSMTSVRKLMQTIGFLGPAFFLSLVTVTHAPFVVVSYMTAALALSSFSQSGVYSNHQVRVLPRM